MTGTLLRGKFQRKFRSLFGRNSNNRRSVSTEIGFNNNSAKRSQSMPDLNGFNTSDNSDECSDSCLRHQVCPCCLDAEAQTATITANNRLMNLPLNPSATLPKMNNNTSDNSDVCSESCPCHQVCPCCLDVEADVVMPPIKTTAAAMASSSSTNSQQSNSSVMQINYHHHETIQTSSSSNNEDQYVVVVSDLNNLTQPLLTVRSETEIETSSRDSSEKTKTNNNHSDNEAFRKVESKQQQRDMKEEMWMKEVDERMRRMELLLMNMKSDEKDVKKEKVGKSKEKDRKYDSKKESKKRHDDEIPPFNALARVLYILRSPDGPRSRMCPFCGSTSFLDIRSLSKHLLGETGRNPHLSSCGPLKGWALDQSKATELFVDMALRKLNKK